MTEGWHGTRNACSSGMPRLFAAIVLSATLAGGCVVREPRATTPDLAYVAPGVHVIANYGEPIFYADGFYWWNYDGYWYRSTHYTGGWAYTPYPPSVLLSIHDPYRYRYYRPHGYVVRHRPQASHRIERPRVRDHRATPAPSRQRSRSRDHRR